MFEQEVYMNSGTRMFTFAMMGNELVAVIYDSRWLLATILICVLADFRFGWGESSKRYNRAKEKGDKLVMAQYKWRTSRALRRSVNKLMDYIMWVSIGVFIGIALLKPIGIDYMMGGVVATFVAVFCEVKSIIGHFFWLHGVAIEKKTIKGFMKAFAISWAKRKDRAFGEAIEDGLKGTEDEDNRVRKEAN